MSIEAYDYGHADGTAKALEAVLALIDQLMENPPMRGDVALSDLRRAVQEQMK